MVDLNFRGKALNVGANSRMIGFAAKCEQGLGRLMLTSWTEVRLCQNMLSHPWLSSGAGYNGVDRCKIEWRVKWHGESNSTTIEDVYHRPALQNPTLSMEDSTCTDSPSLPSGPTEIERIEDEVEDLEKMIQTLNP